MSRVRQVAAHPWAMRTRRVVKTAVVVCSLLLAVVLVTSVTVDLGPVLRKQAEERGSRFLQRPLTIGRLSVRLWNGAFVVEDLKIEGLTPQSKPFLFARRISLSMPWNTLFSRRIVFDAVDMRDWTMFVEMMPDGRHSFPKLPRRAPRGQSAWTTTVQYVRASGGEFTYQDHGTPWTVVARNLDVTVARPATEYRGEARFSNGSVAMQSYAPFRIDMASVFKIDGGLIRFERIDLTSDGAKTQLTGAVDTARWPEQTYQLRSVIDFPTQKKIWFARDQFDVSGTGEFAGTFHLFKETLPDGRTRTGRELKGTFDSRVIGVNYYRFQDVRGSVLWVPEKLEVFDARAGVYGGAADFSYRMAPLNQRGVRPTATFDTRYANVDLTTFMSAMEVQGIRLSGRASGRNLLEWPLGRFAERRGEGVVNLAPPGGMAMMSRRVAGAAVPAVDSPARPNTPATTLSVGAPVSAGGELRYTLAPGRIEVAPSWIATQSTFVAFDGRTAYGGDSAIPFHVSSADWQESDRVFAGILTAFGARTGVIPIGGSGTFDGVMTNTFRRPRIEGVFTGERMRAWDVEWGSASGKAVIENSYADVQDVVITSGDSSIEATGRFSLGFPRRDGGEELNARVRIVRRPVSDLRHAFELDTYRLDGALSGEFHVYGRYQRPLGYGAMEIVGGTAYGEPFESATAAVRLEGAGVRLDSLQMIKGSGRGTGAAYVGWDSTYSFNFSGTGIPVESVAATRAASMPLSGLIDFMATGSGTFDRPRYDVHGTIRDFFVADEGIGEVVGDIGINGDVMTLQLEAASPRLAVSGNGRVFLTPDMEAELSFTVADTSLDPYVRAFEPRLSPYTTAVASGSVRVKGALANVDRLLVEATVDRLDMRLFDYQLRNATPIRVALDRHSVRIAEMRLVGEETKLDVSGIVALHDERIKLEATGDANLGILQGFVSDVRSTGRAALSATLEGALRNPAVNGTLTVENGRIRHFALPHALENITGPLRFDSRGVTLDGLNARLGGGDVRFGGRVDKDGYQVGRLDVTMAGRDMQLRFPEGMRSRVDADLALQGTVGLMTLSGSVLVRDAAYTRELDTSGGFFDRADDLPSGSSFTQTTLPLRYDVRIAAPSSLQVRNSLLRLTASADLELRGTYDRPLLFGRAEVERGDATFEGKRYVITRGTIDFNNPTRIEPFFDIEAETRVRVPNETYRITVSAAGTPTRITPGQLLITSDPPLPPVEVLALLFSDVAPGQDVELRQYSTDITPQQQLFRERATRALTGQISSEVGRVVEQTFGVDTFQITPSLVDPNQQSSRLDPAARLTIGKRLSERAYVTYSRSLSSTTRDQIILLEYDRTDQLSWILSRNEDGAYAVELRVRHSF